MWCEHRIADHPCFDQQASRRVGRIHLPVAPRCNIKCRYCTRKYDCANENRPGLASRVLTPEEALRAVAEAVRRDDRIKVVGIAGPGDPLTNPETIETLYLVHGRFPELALCLSTNGLLLPEMVERLVRAGVATITVTVNAVEATVGGEIYDWIYYQGRIWRGREGAGILLTNQLAGIREAVASGLAVKVNTVFIPGINDRHMTRIAEVMRELGACVMNILPLIPQADFARWTPPSREELHRVRAENGAILRQVAHCRQCRADAVGLIGEL